MTPDIEQAQRVTVGPEDVIVVSVPGILSDETANRLRDQFRERVFPNNVVVVVSEGMQISNVTMDKRIAAMDAKLDKLIEAAGLQGVAP